MKMTDHMKMTDQERMNKCVAQFIEMYDNEEGCIYQYPEAMELLEWADEKFVNAVINGVDKGYRIGMDLRNFEYDEEEDKWVIIGWC